MPVFINSIQQPVDCNVEHKHAEIVCPNYALPKIRNSHSRYSNKNVQTHTCTTETPDLT